MMTLDNFITKTIDVLIKGLILIMPLFFLPNTILDAGIDNYGKLQLLLLLIPFIVILWLVKSFISQKLKINSTPLFIPIFVFVSILCFSVIFSIDKFSSFFGSFYDFSSPFLAMLILFLGYFFLAQYLNQAKSLGIIKAYLFGYAVLVFIGVFLAVGMAGGWLESNNKISVFLNLASGQLGDLALYISVSFVLLLNMFIYQDLKGLIFKNSLFSFCFKIILFLSLVLLILINFNLSWWLLLLGISASMVLKLFKNSLPFKTKLAADKRIYFILTALILFCLLFVFNSYNADRTGNDSRFKEPQQLNFNGTLDIVKAAVIERPILGHGPETFAYLYSKFRSADYNQGDLWHFRYNRGSSYLLELAAYSGILGILSYSIILFLIIYQLVIFVIRLHRQSKSNNEIEKNSRAIIFSAIPSLLLLIAAQFLHSVNILLLFIFWLILAIIMTNINKAQDAKFNRQAVFPIAINGIRAAQIVLIMAVVLTVAWLALISLSAKHVLARAYYKSGADNNFYLKAAQLNPNRYNYHALLAKLYLEKALNNLSQAGEKDLFSIQGAINQSIQAAKEAVRTAPHSVAAHETLGMVYQNLEQYIDDNNNFAVEAFQEASKLEPTNPVIFTEIGKAYMNKGELDKAAIEFSRALKLKPAYYEAAYNLALLFEKENKLNQALDLLNDLEIYHNRFEINSTKGRIYFNQKKYSEAIAEYKKAVELNSQHANSLYGLALALEVAEEKAEALSYFKKTLSLNPENEELLNKITTLEKEIKD